MQISNNILPQYYKKIVVTLALLLVVSIVATIMWFFWDKKTDNSAILVQTVAAKISEMPIVFKVPGNIEADKSVAIVSQVPGVIKNIAFKQGDNLKIGQLLFTIDSAVYKQTLAQARAALQKDMATLDQNKITVKRLAELTSSSDVSKQEFEQAELQEKIQAAIVATSQAELEKAEIQLGYTEIRAPISGKAGEIMVREGNYVNNNSTQALVVINTIDTVLANFYLTQEKLAVILQQPQAQISAEVVNEDNATILGTGKLVFVDNKISVNTGTILLKIQISNQQQKLWPGMLVVVNLMVGKDLNAIVIPMLGLQLDQQGHFVYCVDKQRVKIKRVTFARQVGDLAVISNGLDGSEKIITIFPPQLAEGALIKERNN